MKLKEELSKRLRAEKRPADKTIKSLKKTEEARRNSKTTSIKRSTEKKAMNRITDQNLKEARIVANSRLGLGAIKITKKGLLNNSTGALIDVDMAKDVKRREMKKFNNTADKKPSNPKRKPYDPR